MRCHRPDRGESNGKAHFVFERCFILLKCDGACGKTGTCKGVARRVRVTNRERTVDWGFRNLCQKAIYAERAEGFLVEVQDERVKVADFLRGKF